MRQFNRLLLWAKLVPGWLAWVALSTLLIVVAEVFVTHSGWTGAFYIPLFVFVEGLSRSPKWAAWLVARQAVGGFLLAALFASSAFVMPLLRPSDHLFTAMSGSPTKADCIFAFVGLLVGLQLRDRAESVPFRALIGRRRLRSSLGLTVVWTIAIVAFPLWRHEPSRGVYLLSLAIGMLLHKSNTIGMAQANAAYRRLQDIADAFPPGESATRAEIQALDLLAQGRQFPSGGFRRLREFLEDCQKHGLTTRRLTLIGASAHRLEGRYELALEETKDIPSPLREPADAHLGVLRVMTLDELGRDDEADRLLEMLLLDPLGKNCPIANALRAERLSHEAVDELPPKGPSHAALNAVLLALQRRAAIMRERGRKGAASSVDQFLARFLEIGVPVTPSFMLNILGFALVAAGYPEESRVMLIRCIGMDPKFSSAYLHLGDTFLLRSVLSYGATNPTAADLWHASACYHAAVLVERTRRSRVHRLASVRLDQVSKLRGIPHK
jgi:hypothetical protein